MESFGRVSHPSLAQVEALVQYLEERPQLAKGFLRNPSAKAQARKEWEMITSKLNSIGGGTIKSVQKWIKYWADKKSAIKKKAALRAAARRRTGGGNVEVLELNGIEERIVALMGGGGFATGDVHLQIPVFDEPTSDADDSPSILVGFSEQNNEPNTNVAHECPSTSFNLDTPVYSVEMPNVHRELSPQHLDQPHHQPAAASQACELRELSTRAPASPLAAGDRDNLPHNTASVGSTPRRRRFRVRRSPPSQRRSQFVSISEIFLRIEEQRVDLERRIVAVLESHIETGRLMAQANLALGEGLKAVAEILNKK
ncbi:uncharacterized protein LOC119190340 [Manduca sexta]|uniref:uncharacterized protein LOC119190340 n=1 Tax=Manduca sexta TaxID=7130 RepID=UPI00188F2659|nr:uncharacterized protein LOC119190340 [Manduca sexta]